MAERLEHNIIGYGAAYKLGLVIPEWLVNQNWRAYIDRYPLSQEKSPIFLNEVRIIEKISGPVIEKVLSLPENSDRTGLVFAIAHRGEPLTRPVASIYGIIKKPDPNYGQKLFKYSDFAYLKANFLIENKDLIASAQNLELPEEKQWLTYIEGSKVPAGAIAFKNGVILSVSGLSNGEKDTAAVLAIGIEAHLIREQVAKKLARRFNAFKDLTDILKVL